MMMNSFARCTLGYRAIDRNVTTRLVSQLLFGTGAYIVHPSPTQPGSQGLSSYAPGGKGGGSKMRDPGNKVVTHLT